MEIDPLFSCFQSQMAYTHFALGKALNADIAGVEGIDDQKMHSGREKPPSLNRKTRPKVPLSFTRHEKNYVSKK